MSQGQLWDVMDALLLATITAECAELSKDVTFFEYLEEIVLYCYKKNNNLKAYRLNWLRERSGGLGLLGAPPSRCP